MKKGGYRAIIATPPCGKQSIALDFSAAMLPHIVMYPYLEAKSSSHRSTEGGSTMATATSFINLAVEDALT